MLEAVDLTFRAGSRDLVSGLSAAFEPGALHLIVGPNGAGKSTFLKLLSRLLRPSSGCVLYDGVDVATAREPELAKYRAVLSQAIELAFPLSVEEVVMMGRYPHFGGRPSRQDALICGEVMALFDVQGLAGQSYSTLSGGEKQRVNFARVLAQIWRPVPGRTRYLFLDEPLTFLDVRHQIAFMKTVRDFGRAADVLAVGVVHDLALAARFADRLIMMHQGRIAAQGRPGAVLTPALIRTVFEVEPRFVDAGDGSGVHLVFD